MIADPRTLLAKYRLNAKRSWGQNFLISTRVYDAIVRATVAAPGEWVVEVGAGLGTLTARLAEALPTGRVIAVERDRDLAKVLREELGAVANVEIAEANALTFDYSAVAARAGGPIAVVGNLPYQIASPLVFAMLEQRQSISRAVIMLQKEMADRLVARPDTSEYGAMGVMVGAYADVRRVTAAPSQAFHPAPRVDSAVVAITPRAMPRAPIPDERKFSAVVHAGFGQRRKTLRNALRARWVVDEVDAALTATGLDGQRRGETLSIEEFAALAVAFGAFPAPLAPAPE